MRLCALILLAMSGCAAAPPPAAPCPATPSPAQAASAPASDAHEVEEAMRAYGEARARGDVAALERLLAPEYVHIHVNGQVQSGKEWLDDVRARKSAVKIDQEDVKIRMLGDVAVVTGKNLVRGADPKEMALRFTQVWVKRDGAWRRAFFQGTTLAY